MQKSLAGVGLVLLTVSCADAQQVGGEWPSPDQTPYSTESILGLRAEAPQCRAEGVVATADSIGPIKAGDTLRDVLANCSGRGLKIWDWGSEGIPEPGVLQLFGNDLVLSVLEDTASAALVYRVVSADARTPDGITGGSSFAALQEALGEIRLVEGECQLWAVGADGEGLSFLIDWPEEHGIDCSELPGLVQRNDVSRVPPESVIRLLNHYSG